MVRESREEGVGPELGACRRAAGLLFELGVHPQRRDLALENLSGCSYCPQQLTQKPLHSQEAGVRTKAKWPQGLRGGRKGETPRLLSSLQI